MADKTSGRGEAVDERFDDDLDIAEVDDKPRGTTVVSRGKAGAAARTARRDGRPGLLGRFIRFVREIVAELAKVIWPTRKELMTYTVVVITFVTIVVTIVAGLDVGFAKLMVLVFGRSS